MKIKMLALATASLVALAPMAAGAAKPTFDHYAKLRLGQLSDRLGDKGPRAKEARAHGVELAAADGRGFRIRAFGELDQHEHVTIVRRQRRNCRAQAIERALPVDRLVERRLGRFRHFDVDVVRHIPRVDPRAPVHEVARDAEEPGQERAASCVVGVGMTEQVHEDVLRHVGGDRGRPRPEEREAIDGTAVALIERGKRSGIAAGDARRKRGVAGGYTL